MPSAPLATCDRMGWRFVIPCEGRLDEYVRFLHHTLPNPQPVTKRIRGASATRMPADVRQPQDPSTEEESRRDVIVIGAGPAGLTCAYELTRLGYRPLVLERNDRVGGLARTEEIDGYRFDIGGHRYHTQVAEVEALWRDLLGDDLIERPRLSRIFYQGRFFRYPIDPLDVLGKVGAVEGLRILASYAATRIRERVRGDEEVRTFEEWVTRAFGQRLYQIFFKSYTEKVWGTPCSQISADWAAQRIRRLTLGGALKEAVVRSSEHRTLTRTFLYPRLGPGQMWEALAERVRENGGEIRTGMEVVEILRQGDQLTGVTVRSADPAAPLASIGANHFVSTMPLSHLTRRLSPAPPPEASTAGAHLTYRGLVEVLLLLEGKNPFPDTWIYVHEPGLQVARIQNFRNWSPDLIPPGGGQSIGMEYFCDEGDPLWRASDEELTDLAWSELEHLQLGERRHGRTGLVVREAEAYPVYTPDYLDRLAVLRAFLDGLQNLQTIGRNGMHRYNNMDHSVLMGLYAARNIAGADHSVWSVNTARSYYEEFQLP